MELVSVQRPDDTDHLRHSECSFCLETYRPSERSIDFLCCQCSMHLHEYLYWLELSGVKRCPKCRTNLDHTIINRLYPANGIYSPQRRGLIQIEFGPVSEKYQLIEIFKIATARRFFAHEDENSTHPVRGRSAIWQSISLIREALSTAFEPVNISRIYYIHERISSKIESVPKPWESEYRRQINEPRRYDARLIILDSAARTTPPSPNPPNQRPIILTQIPHETPENTIFVRAESRIIRKCKSTISSDVHHFCFVCHANTRFDELGTAFLGFGGDVISLTGCGRLGKAPVLYRFQEFLPFFLIEGDDGHFITFDWNATIQSAGLKNGSQLWIEESELNQPYHESTNRNSCAMEADPSWLSIGLLQLASNPGICTPQSRLHIRHALPDYTMDGGQNARLLLESRYGDSFVSAGRTLPPPQRRVIRPSVEIDDSDEWSAHYKEVESRNAIYQRLLSKAIKSLIMDTPGLLDCISGNDTHRDDTDAVAAKAVDVSMKSSVPTLVDYNLPIRSQPPTPFHPSRELHDSSSDTNPPSCSSSLTTSSLSEKQDDNTKLPIDNTNQRSESDSPSSASEDDDGGSDPLLNVEYKPFPGQNQTPSNLECQRLSRRYREARRVRRVERYGYELGARRMGMSGCGRGGGRRCAVR